jgi:hypothetical protein
MRVLVCGGRDFTNIAVIWRFMDRLNAETPITEIITGGQRGADTIANEWAKTKPIKRYISKADWTTYGRAAGPKRNARMLEWNPDVVIAFPGGTGTADMVAKAKNAGIRIIIPPF